MTSNSAHAWWFRLLKLAEVHRGWRAATYGRLMTVTLQQLREARMVSLLLDAPAPRRPLDVVRWFGAMQAQDVASGHWSLGLRCAGSTDATIVDAFETRDVVRTWPMRGTIHLVPAEDVRWMLELTGSRMLATSVRRRENLGLTLADAELATTVLEQALRQRHVLTRAEAIAGMADAGINVSEQRSYHLLWYAAQIGVTCIGPQRGSDQTFVLVSEWAPVQVRHTRDEALAELFLRFVRSHGPVPLQDFAGWTGLPMGDTKKAAKANDGRVRTIASAAGELWVTTELAEHLAAGIEPHPVVVAPGFDEFMLGYKDRTLQVPEGAFDRIVPGGNGMFRATVVAGGVAVATWKRTMRANKVVVDVEAIAKITPPQRKQMRAAFERYAGFLDTGLELRETN